MARITGELDLSQIPDEQYKSDLDLRVAVVREGSVLGSAVLKARSAKQRRLPFEVEFEPPILPGTRLPCPVVLVAGPNVADRELLGIDTVKQVVELAHVKERGAAKTAATRNAELKIGRIAVEPLVHLDARAGRADPARQLLAGGEVVLDDGDARHAVHYRAAGLGGVRKISSAA